jgi:hypothetical protein
MEHNGQKFPLIRLDRKTFEHGNETGFVLEGKHKLQSCEACHTAKKMPAAARAEIKIKDPSHSFLGLRRECLACHEDRHKGQLGSNCLKCHNQEAWKPVTGFDHAQTKFALTGQHQTVACVKCHAPRPGEGGEALQFTGLIATGCQSCHKDPHQGAFQEAKFRGSCESCHNTGGFRKAKPGAGFTHDKTAFPLAGKHAGVSCLRCHKDSNFHRAIAHDRCQSCHEDPHNRQFAARAAGSDCSACHNETGFKPALFDRAAHQRTAFRLEAKHEALDCAKCHKPEGRATVYVIRMLTCAQCHADPHAGEFAPAPVKNDCASCPRQEGFRPATFDVARHGRTKFALTGKHAVVECAKCHKPLTAPAVEAAKPMLAMSKAAGTQRQYHFESLACGACHKDPHETKLSCETCHVPEDWKRVAAFNHAKTQFQLEGGHEKAACVKCHTPSAKSIPKFAKTASQCDACHQKDEVHGGQFRTVGRIEDCATCHVPKQWKIAGFNHDQTRFPLDRAHRQVNCEKCHKEPLTSGKKIRMYRDTPKECVQCH